MLVNMTGKQIAGYLKAAKEPLGISFNDAYNKSTYGITKAEFDEINRAMHAEYGMFPERTTAGVKKALAARGGSRHATKPQRAIYDEVSRKSAEANETFLEMLPTMKRHELEQLIKKRPSLWGRFSGYLTSGHRFVDDPPASGHARKKSGPQLDREISEFLAKKPHHATIRGCVKCGPHHAAIKECATWDPNSPVEHLTEAKRQAASEYERCYLVNLMQKAGSVSEAARLAGLDRSNFKKLLHRHGMRVPKESAAEGHATKRRSHSTMHKHHIYRVTQDHRIPSELRGKRVVYLGEKTLPAGGGMMARVALLESDGSTGDEYLVREHHLYK
jgi:hypothetical protein